MTKRLSSALWLLLGVVSIAGLYVMVTSSLETDDTSQRTTAAKESPRLPTASLQHGVDPTRATTLRRAVRQLETSCPRLRRHAQLVTAVDARYEAFGPDPTDYRARDYGWTGKLVVDVQARTGGELPNQHHRPESSLRLSFAVGGGQRPGITASTRASKWMCAMQTGEPSDGFIDVPALEYLGALDPP